MRRVQHIAGAALVGLVGCEQSVVVLDLTRTDTFTQTAVLEPSDVLFVVDNSQSMAEEQALLSDGVLGFVGALGATEADYRFIVVTTDTSAADAGLARGGVLDPFMPDLDAAAVAALAVGTRGSRAEEGLRAAVMALDGRNPGFPRESARLDVVFISDEDDQSKGAVEELLPEIRAAAGGVGFAVHGVVGDLPAGCASPGGAASAGPRYHEAILQTEGQVESICADSYEVVLERVGLVASGLTDTFLLTSIPESNTLEVWVDEVRMPARERDGWQYDPGQNAIVFDGYSVPRAGMEVVVHYEPLPQGAVDTDIPG